MREMRAALIQANLKMAADDVIYRAAFLARAARFGAGADSYWLR